MVSARRLAGRPRQLPVSAAHLAFALWRGVEGVAKSGGLFGMGWAWAWAWAWTREGSATDCHGLPLAPLLL